MSYLQIFKEYCVSRPVDLREKILIQHFAHQLKQIDFTLIVRLTLQQREERRLPLSVIDSLYEFADHWRDSVGDEMMHKMSIV